MTRETIEAADWHADGDEKTIDLIRTNIRKAFKAVEAKGYIVLPISWKTLAPGDERVPMPPEGIENPRLLVGEAEVIKRSIRVEEAGFVNDLERKDLNDLRAATRRAHQSVNPGAARLSDAECDDVINRIGPQSAVGMLRRGMH